MSNIENNSKKTLYLECTFGISGDMTVGALLDLGADEKVLNKVLESVPAKGFTTKISRVKKSGLDVCDFDVILDEHHDNHDHDMNYLYGHDEKMHNHEHEHNHDHEHNHEHSHEHEHGHEHEHNDEHGHSHSHDMHTHVHHEHRGIKEVNSIIDATDMTENARTIAKKIFDVLCKAEAKAHGEPYEQVHFHEVGAIDSIVDIISVAVCIDNLNINNCIVTSLVEGSGTVRCQHGILPIPVPAVLNIVQMNNIPLSFSGKTGEYVTPTGAAIVAAICTSNMLPEQFTVEKVGMGAGKREYETPSILRAMLIN